MACKIRPRLVIPSRPAPVKNYDQHSFGPEGEQRSGYIKNAYYNGLGRCVSQLERVTFKFDKIGGNAKGLRDFIQQDLIDFCRTNPGVVVYLKPRRKPTPVMLSEYLDGRRHWFNLRNMERIHIKEWLDYHVTRSGLPIQRFIKPHQSSWPSIQSVWTPFLHVPPEMNVAQFPVEGRGRARQPHLSATEQLLRLQDNVHNLHVLKEHPSERE